MAKNKDVAPEMELDGEAEVRVYELGFHLDPELPTEGIKKAYEAVRDIISANGTLVAEGEPQMIQLAYMISRQETAGRRDFNSAYFSWIAYEATPEAHAEVVTAAGANKSIVRFIDLVTTKEAARHAVEIHEFTAAAAKPASEEATEEGEVAADAELDAALQSATL
jgi:ribosomal protein S6